MPPTKLTYRAGLIASELVEVVPLGAPRNDIYLYEFHYGITNPNTGESILVLPEAEPDKFYRYTNKITNKFIHVCD